MNEYFTVDNMMYVYYGKYPQTVVTDSNLISSLDSLTSTNTNGYYEYQGEEYSKAVAIPTRLDYRFGDGSTIILNQTYYFKAEPIKWRVLEEVDGIYTLLSEYIIDRQVYYPLVSTRTIDGKLVHPNNYEHSTIREWLNNGFYNSAFSIQERSDILTSFVDNSLSTLGSRSNFHIDNNTYNKVYLLSYQEARSSTYGFVNSSSRTAIPTDYAKALGVSMIILDGYYGNGAWWLRSPSIDYSCYAYYVYDDGSINDINVNITFFGTRPAIKIN